MHAIVICDVGCGMWDGDVMAWVAHPQERVGRRTGFLIGGTSALIGCGICVLAIRAKNFYVLMLGAVVMGGFGAFSSYMRFAAVEATCKRIVAPRYLSFLPLLLPVSRNEEGTL